jgi:hypothetical protein
MNLSPVKIEILEALLLREKPVKALEIAQEIAVDRPAVQMHLIGLVRMGCAASPAKGFYVISENGKKALGIPEVTKELALRILGHTSLDKSFYFYKEIGRPLNLLAQDLLSFCDKITKVDDESIKFHTERGDFEVWFEALGDVELVKKMSFLKRKDLPSEELRAKIREMVENRCMKLSMSAGKASTVI